MLSDAMYALSDVVAFAAASENQFLNMIGAQIDRDLRLYLDFMEPSLTSISHSKIVLDEHLRSSLETLTCLRSRGGAHWPYTPEEKSDGRRRVQPVDDVVSDLVADYEALVTKTQSLIQRCIEGSDLITSRTSMDESRRAVEQNSRIGRLTKLAFFFVPTSFVGTFFGMNFKEFGQGDLRIWIGVVVMAAFILASAAFCYSDELSREWKRVTENFGTRPPPHRF